MWGFNGELWGFNGELVGQVIIGQRPLGNRR